MATPTARETYIDFGEALDLAQVLGQGGNVRSGQTFSNLFYGAATTQDSLVAHAGGGQALGTPVPAKPIARFITVATAADSATLPPSVAGYEIAIINSGANSMNVFPTVGESMNTVLNASVAIPAGQLLLFLCVTAGAWYTK